MVGAREGAGGQTIRHEWQPTSSAMVILVVPCSMNVHIFVRSGP